MSKPPIANNSVLPGLLDVQGGVTLRDVFAAVAMHTLMAKDFNPERAVEMMSYLPCACYKVADYMLAERAKSHDPDEMTVDESELEASTPQVTTEDFVTDGEAYFGFCSSRLSDYKCDLIHGHEGVHASGPVSWIESAANAEELAAEACARVDAEEFSATDSGTLEPNEALPLLRMVGQQRGVKT